MSWSSRTGLAVYTPQMLEADFQNGHVDEYSMRVGTLTVRYTDGSVEYFSESA